MTLDELQDRLLRHAETLKVPADAGKEKFAAALGVVDFVIGRPGTEYEIAIQPMTDGYSFVASTMPSSSGFPMNEVRVMLPDGRGPVRRPVSVCLWEAAEFSKRLEAIGYKPGPKFDFQRGWIQSHWRPIGEGKQGFGVNLLIYRVGSDEVRRDCVYGVIFDGGNT
ncbi:hypothetical protein OK348_07590 [Flavobacterium sp. MXW15]|uniref:Uncharacterized protein n=1 Tax=Xanthomonas chitinilytica TaxID=2989819 RepID=A0ABT3JTS3_9XANT|nr:hypothetical protein [Xanthomonas sp. H13-6]MCW4454658.1 hypothetical protein [Flavobacterium sp. MXW15]MCW4471897.1 hypothetical protein [Xanthomonas sp. H13-6]